MLEFALNGTEVAVNALPDAPSGGHPVRLDRAPRFFEDLQGAQSAVLYVPVGTIGRLFMAIKAQAFKMAA